jgi:hypothetical protein
VRKLISLFLAFSAVVPNFAINSHAYDPLLEPVAVALNEKAIRIWEMVCDIFRNLKGDAARIRAIAELVVEGILPYARAQFPDSNDDAPEIWALVEEIVREVWDVAYPRYPDSSSDSPVVCAAVKTIFKERYPRKPQVLDPKTFEEKKKGMALGYRAVEVCREELTVSAALNEELAAKVRAGEDLPEGFSTLDCAYAHFKDVPLHHRINECAAWWAIRDTQEENPARTVPGIIIPFYYYRNNVREVNYQVLQTFSDIAFAKNPNLRGKENFTTVDSDPRTNFLAWCFAKNELEHLGMLMGVQAIKYVSAPKEPSLIILDDSVIYFSSGNISVPVTGRRIMGWTAVSLGGGKFTTGVDSADQEVEITQF